MRFNFLTNCDYFARQDGDDREAVPACPGEGGRHWQQGDSGGSRTSRNGCSLLDAYAGQSAKRIYFYSDFHYYNKTIHNFKIIAILKML